MKKTSVQFLSLLLLLCVAASGADDKESTTGSSRIITVSKCHIALIDSVTLASDRSGILKHVEFKEGQTVAEDTLVALIDDNVARANLAVAKKKSENDVEVKLAQAAEESAKKEYEMAKKSFEKSGGKAVSELDVDKAEFAWTKAKLTKEHAAHELEKAKLDFEVSEAELKTYSVRSGFPGTITKIYKKKHEAVRQGDPIADIVNTDRVRIEGEVKIEDLRVVKQGAKVKVRLLLEDEDIPEEDEVFEGRITFVDLVSQGVSQTTIVFAEVQNRDNVLRAGLSAEMEIEVDEETQKNADRVRDEGKTQKKVTKLGR